MADLFADIRYALRWLRRSPGFTSIAVDLARRSGSASTPRSSRIVDAVLFRPLPVERPDRLVDIYHEQPRRRRRTRRSSYPDYLDIKAKNEVFSDVLGFSPSLAAVKLADGRDIRARRGGDRQLFPAARHRAADWPHAAAGRRSRPARRASRCCRIACGCANTAASASARRPDDAHPQPGVHDRRRRAARVHGDVPDDLHRVVDHDGALRRRRAGRHHRYRRRRRRHRSRSSSAAATAGCFSKDVSRPIRRSAGRRQPRGRDEAARGRRIPRPTRTGASR